MTPIAQSIADTAQSGWDSMVHALKVAEDERRQAEQLATRLLAETDMLRDEIVGLNTELKVWKAHVIAVDTALKIAANIINEARNDARIEAVEKAQEPDGTDPAKTPVTTQWPPQAQGEFIGQKAADCLLPINQL